MILNLLISTLLSIPAVIENNDTTLILQEEVPSHQVEVENTYDDGYWKRKKYNRISFNTNHFSFLSSTEEMPVTLSLGLDTGRNIYLHKTPIAGMLKIGLDLGFDFNYMAFDLESDHNDYEGPSGYVGDAPLEDYGDMDFFANLSGHHISLGLAIGPSLTLNPIDKVRICGYAHFVPSASFFAQGMSMNIGYSPMMKYGLEASYGMIGFGVEYNHGLNTYTDMINYITVKGNDGDVSQLYKARYYLESFQVYLSFRFGKK